MLDLTRKKIDEWWKNQGSDREFTLSASVLGDQCQRRLWYKLHGAPPEPFDGRMRRLFDRGHREEERFVMALRGIGCDVWGEQQRLYDCGEYIGSIDGMVLGLPEAPKTTHLLEMKTANDKNFKAIVKDGHPPFKHIVQMQVYMHLLQVTRALYLVINKNDDQIWQARLDYNKEFAKAQLAKRDRLMMLKAPPERIDDRPEYYICKVCYLRDECHGLNKYKIT